MLREAVRAGHDVLSALGTNVRLRALSRSRASVAGRLWLHGDGRLTAGLDVHFAGGDTGIELQIERAAEVVIGSGTSIGCGTSIEARQRIAVGARCRIGRYCKLLDNHLHQLRGARDARPPSVPIVIEDDVTIEDFVTLLPGAHIGKGAHVGRGAVLSRRIPAGARVPPQAVHPARDRLAPAVAAANGGAASARSMVRVSSAPQAGNGVGRRGGGGTYRPSAGTATWADRARRKLQVATHVARAQLELSGCELGRHVRTSGHVHVDRSGGRIVIGHGTTLLGGLRPTELLASSDTTLSIDAACAINYAARFDARADSISLGKNCMIGSWVQVLTAHGAPVVLEDDVWVAHGAVIEPGTRIGAGSVIAAGAVVRGEIAPQSLVVGYPGRAMSLDLRFEGRG